MSSNVHSDIVTAVIARLQGQITNIPPDQIRGKLDMSTAPTGGKAIVVGCQNQGCYGGMVDIPLFQALLSVACMTHMDEDVTGSACSALANNVAAALDGHQLSLSGYDCRLLALVSVSEPEAMEAFRVVKMDYKLYLQSKE
jgi:hypothetical protein